MTSRTSLAGVSGPFFVVFGIASVGVIGLLGSSAEPSLGAPPAPRPASFEALGAGSCAASACHGGPREQGVHNSEYSIWATFDKHASAYSVLFDDRSRRMDAAYSHKEYKDAHPENNLLCLRCHGLQQASNRPELQLDGVSCESCHGPASAWLNQHYLPYWKASSPKAKADLGYIDTHDLLQRGKACAACHVGDPTKEVNHDLVAAGHPRLQFEYSAYLAMEVKHWDAAAEKVRVPDLEIRTWALGQLLSAQAALELLATRACDDAVTLPPEKARHWPEFAEYDCFACHHDLKSESWRIKERLRADQLADKSEAKRRPGTLDWGSWYTAELPQALVASHSAKAQEIESAIGEIRKKMATAQDRLSLKEEAKKTAAMLGEAAKTLAKENNTPHSFDNLLDALLHPNDNRNELTWDRATQMYLGLAAAVNARNDREPNRIDPRFQQQVRDIATLLRFPPGCNDNDRFDSPSNFNPKKVRKAFQDLGPASPK